jgi:hypothetical protein|tara:strand:+ start:68 stop:328 length:261 start_codon:yes stop_codon:yes gene_type:complete
MFKVMKTACKDCLFTKNKIVSDARKNQLLGDIKDEQSYFLCHESQEGNEATHCCKMFYDIRGHESQTIRVAQRLGMVEFSLPTKAQ